MMDKTLTPVTSTGLYQVKEINFREYFLVVFKRRWIIVACLILAAAIAAIYSFLQTPTYRTKSRININPVFFKVLPEVISQNQAQLDVFMETQNQLLRSASLARRVQERLKLAPEDVVPPDEKNEVAAVWKKRKPEARANYVGDMLLRMLDVIPVPNTTLFEIQFETPSARLSANLANIWADEYMEYSLASQYEYSVKAEELIAQQISQLRKEISEKQGLLQKFSSTQQVIKLDDARSMHGSKLEQLNEDLSRAISDRITKQVAYRDLQRQGKDSVPEIRNNAVIIRLKQEYSTLETEYTKKASLFMSDYPQMVTLRNQMDQIKTALEDEGNELFTKVLASARAEYEAASRNEGALRSEVESVKQETIYARPEEFNYERLKLEVDEKQKNLETLLQRQSEATASVQAKEMKATTIRVVDEARIPGLPYKPNILYNIVFGIFGGLVLGVGLAFGADYMDRSFRQVEDVERHLQLPFLGVIPRYSIPGENNGRSRFLPAKRTPQNGSTTEGIDLVTVYSPESLESEAFKNVRASLLVSFPENPPKTIVVTSGKPGEGKTFVASNLAVTLAQLDKKIVLIDADLRNPRIHRVWKMNNDFGLSTFLTSNIPLAEVLKPTEFENLDIIPSGAKTPRPAELLSSKRFDQLLTELQTRFDHIIIDSPPVMPVSDALVIASKCNCAILVVRAGETPREVVQVARERLSHFDVTVAGVVLNDVDLNDPYYKFSYANYGDYYGKD